MLDSIDLSSRLEMEDIKDAWRAHVQTLRRLGRQPGVTVVSSDDAGRKKVAEMVAMIRNSSGCDELKKKVEAAFQKCTGTLNKPEPTANPALPATPEKKMRLRGRSTRPH